MPRNPCLSCALLEADKNNETCMNCRARVDYACSISMENPPDRIDPPVNASLPVRTCVYCGKTAPEDHFWGKSAVCWECDRKRRDGEALTHSTGKRVCTKCGIEKDTNEISIRSNGYVLRRCKACQNIDAQTKRQKTEGDEMTKTKKEDDIELRVCKTCG